MLDSNVLVSALLSRSSIPGQALDKAAIQNTLLFSEATWTELEIVLLRPKFDSYASLAKRQKALTSIKNERVTIAQRVRVCRDPKDDMILEVALNGRADFIVSGDRDLLSLGRFGEIPIVTPAQYVAGV